MTKTDAESRQMDKDELRARIAAAGLTYREVAGRLHVHQVTVARWAAGLAPIPPRAAAHIRAVFTEK
jgi:transcriptional regulator with XRE-family HTH domain